MEMKDFSQNLHLKDCFEMTAC